MIDALFQYTRSRVTDQDISDFSPSDPGHGNYVRMWTQIRRSGVVPREVEFDLSEVIGLVGGWGKPCRYDGEPGFHRFRRFTSAVGHALLHFGNDSEEVRPSNYLARDLLIDLDRDSRKHISIVHAASIATREALLKTNSEEGYPFYTLATMILAQIDRDWSGAEAAASQLICDESAVRHNEALNWMITDDRFLLGLSNYDQLHNEWISFAKELKNPNHHEDTQLVIDALKPKGITSHGRPTSCPP